MITWLMALAIAAPPEGVELEDLDLWEKRSQALLDGPAGCWDFSGTVETTFAAYTPPTLFSRAQRHDRKLGGTFEGRFSDGHWLSFQYELEPKGDWGDEADSDFGVPLFPMMGKIDQKVVKRANPDEEGGAARVEVKDASGRAMNLLHNVLDEINPATTIAHAEWSEPESGVVLYQDMPLKDGRNADVVTLTTYLPGGGEQATRLDAVFPRRVRVGEGMLKATIFDAQMHLRGQPDASGVLPALESVSLGIGVLGFTVGYEQKLTYARAATCPP